MMALSDNDLSAVYGGVTGDTLLEWNGIKYVEYAVQSGDCLSNIAAHYHVSLETILRINPEILNPDLIEIGQVIRIPYIA